MRNLYLAKELHFPSGIRKLMRIYFSINLRLNCPSDTFLVEMKRSSRIDSNVTPVFRSNLATQLIGQLQ